MTALEKYAIQSMAMDLKRVSLAIYNESFPMAEMFLKEAKKRKLEISNIYPRHIESIFKSIDQIEIKEQRSAEDTMMYSTLLQNFSTN